MASKARWDRAAKSSTMRFARTTEGSFFNPGPQRLLYSYSNYVRVVCLGCRAQALPGCQCGKWRVRLKPPTKNEWKCQFVILWPGLPTLKVRDCGSNSKVWGVCGMLLLMMAKASKVQCCLFVALNIQMDGVFADMPVVKCRDVFFFTFQVQGLWIARGFFVITAQHITVEVRNSGCCSCKRRGYLIRRGFVHLRRDSSATPVRNFPMKGQSWMPVLSLSHIVP